MPPNRYQPGISLPSGTRPDEAGDRTQVEEHVLRAVDGRLPANDLVWKCQWCDERGTTTGVFYEFGCDPSDDS